MTMFERPAWRRLLGGPAGALGPVVFAALLLALLPAQWAAGGKDALRSLLAPGQTQVRQARDWCRAQLAALAGRTATADQVAALADEVQDLRRRNEELETALAVSGALADAASADAPLLAAQLVRARVLGREARAFLGRRELLDAGAADSVSADALVLDERTVVVDRGQDAGLAVDGLALVGRSVWGRVVSVGTHTASVRRLTEPGYRDLVQIIRGGDERSTAGPRGVLEGTGDVQCRIRRVPVDEPVAVDDLVVSATLEGVLAAPLIYGRVSRIERPSGAAHWEIWMTPAARARPPRVLGVLRLEVQDSGFREERSGSPAALNPES